VREVSGPYYYRTLLSVMTSGVRDVIGCESCMTVVIDAAGTGVLLAKTVTASWAWSVEGGRMPVEELRRGRRVAHSVDGVWDH